VQRLPARRPAGGPDAAGVDAAVAALRAGSLVILPTDTVYGIAAEASNAAAVDRLFLAKGRPRSKAVALLAASAEQAAAVADLSSPIAQRLVNRHWPGALTIVAPALIAFPEGVGTGATIGVRVPADPVVQAIAAQLGRPLAVSSANRSDADAPAALDEAIRDVGAWVALALDGGACPLGVASTVVDICGRRLRVLRQGGIRLEQDGSSPP
jgi:L-threonylcarbamoyladenylate synthase